MRKFIGAVCRIDTETGEVIVKLDNLEQTTPTSTLEKVDDVVKLTENQCVKVLRTLLLEAEQYQTSTEDTGARLVEVGCVISADDGDFLHTSTYKQDKTDVREIILTQKQIDKMVIAILQKASAHESRLLYAIEDILEDIGYVNKSKNETETIHFEPDIGEYGALCAAEFGCASQIPCTECPLFRGFVDKPQDMADRVARYSRNGMK